DRSVPERDSARALTDRDRVARSSRFRIDPQDAVATRAAHPERTRTERRIRRRKAGSHLSDDTAARRVDHANGVRIDAREPSRSAAQQKEECEPEPREHRDQPRKGKSAPQSSRPAPGGLLAFGG